MRKTEKKRRHKKGKVNFQKLFCSFVTFFSLIYKVFTMIENRRLVIKALQDPETYKTIVTVGEETKNI